MIKKLLLLFVTSLSCCLVGYSQEEKDNGPQKGDFSFAATLGYNSYTGKTALDMAGSYRIGAVNTNWFDSKTMVGIEGNWFFSDKWALRLGGGLGFTYAPGYPEVPGTGEELGDVPTYKAVGKSQNLQYNVYLGANRYFNLKKVRNLYLYTGGQLGFAHGVNQIKYDEESSMGSSVGEAYNMRVALTVGMEYYFLPCMFAGFEVAPVAYTYNVTSIQPQAGLKNLSADSHNISVLAAPTIKVGFKF